MYDIVIIGGGPAGVSAGVYAARKKMKAVIVAQEIGGQSTVSELIYNWIGTNAISGNDLAKSFRKHVDEYVANGTLDLKEKVRVVKIEKKAEFHFLVTCSDDTVFETKAVLTCAGSSRRKLDVPGADTYEHKGVTYCASCDGPIFEGQDVVVIGGGNAGFESAAQLLAYCKSVTLLSRGDFRADAITVDKVCANAHMKAIKNAVPTKITGDQFPTAIEYKDAVTGELRTLSTTGIFVEVGQIPNTNFLEGVIDLDEQKRVVIDPWTQKTSTLGIWAAGDCTNIKYHQNNIAAGDAVRALEDIYVTLNT